VVQAADATHQIADGDLSVRLPAPSDRRKDELADLTRSVNAMAEALERSRGLEQQFLLSVSHDLRTPLTSIRGYAEAIQDEAVPPGQASETILAESRRLQRLVQDLLDLARLDARSFSLHLEEVDVAEVAEAVVDALGAEAAAGDLDLVAELSRGADVGEAVVLADRDRLAQVVANLVENALRYARRSVQVVVALDERSVEVAVVDDGEGIPAADLPHVFERLYVAKHVPERRESGSGLGLAIACELAEAMDGRLDVVSASGEGTTFRLVLPRRLSRPPSPA
jgi:signal transduction histidine kinase